MDSMGIDPSPNDLLFYLLLPVFPERETQRNQSFVMPEGHCACEFPCPFGTGVPGVSTYRIPMGIMELLFWMGYTGYNGITNQSVQT